MHAVVGALHAVRMCGVMCGGCVGDGKGVWGVVRWCVGDGEGMWDGKRM